MRDAFCSWLIVIFWLQFFLSVSPRFLNTAPSVWISTGDHWCPDRTEYAALSSSSLLPLPLLLPSLLALVLSPLLCCHCYYYHHHCRCHHYYHFCFYFRCHSYTYCHQKVISGNRNFVNREKAEIIEEKYCLISSVS